MVKLKIQMVSDVTGAITIFVLHVVPVIHDIIYHTENLIFFKNYNLP